MSVATIMSQLGAHLKNLRVFHVAREHMRLASSASNARRLLLTNSGDPAYSTTDTEEAAAFAQDVSHLDDEAAPALEDAFTAYRANVEEPTSFFGVLAAELGLDAEDLGDPIEYAYDEVNGATTIRSRSGPLGQWYEELVRQKYVVVANKITAGSLVADDDNTGSLEVTQVGTDRFFPNCPSGILTFRCTEAEISAPKFSVTLAIDGASKFADGETFLESENELQPEKEFTDGVLGINGLILSRTDLDAPTITGDDGAMFTGMVIGNPQDDDCDEGVFYFSVFRDLAQYHLYVYNSTGRSNTSVVGAAHFDITTGTEVLNITCSGGTTLEITFDHDAAAIQLPTTDDLDEDIAAQIAVFAEDDEFTMAVTNNYAGKFSTKLMHTWRVHLPSGPAKPTDIPTDALAGAGAGNVDNGSYLYAFSYVSPLGESGLGPSSNGVTVADKTSDGKVDVGNITAGPSGTTARRIYRSDDAGATWGLVATISDNVTTTYVDNIAQATVDAAAEPLTEIDEDYATSVQLD